MFNRAAIVPHAGREYAGKLRAQVFKSMTNNTNTSNIRSLIYLCALHSNPSNQPKFYLMNPSEISRESRQSITNQIQNTPFFEQYTGDEHSYKWVADEIHQWFPNANVEAYAPNKHFMDNQEYVNQISTIIGQFIQSNEDSVLIATTDLIHHGPKFSLELPYPQRLHKMKYEERLLQQLSQNQLSPQAIQKEFRASQVPLGCGENGIVLFSKVLGDNLRDLHRSSTIIDYYDSDSITKYNEMRQQGTHDKLFLYDQPLEEIPHLVSYVGIVYNLGDNQIDENWRLHFKMAFALMRSTIRFQIQSKNTKDVFSGKQKAPFRFPKWSVFYKMRRGVFIGSDIAQSRNGKVNCCIGDYEEGSKFNNTADRISDLSNRCHLDAQNRWKAPYDVNKLLNGYVWKIELLQSEKNWRQLRSPDELYQLLKLGNGQHKQELSASISASANNSKGSSNTTIIQRTKKNNGTSKAIEQNDVSQNNTKQNYGVHLKLSNGSATYLPSVALNNPNWSVDQYMDSLYDKATGLRGSNGAWKSSNSTIRIYTTIEISWDPQTQKILRTK